MMSEESIFFDGQEKERTIQKTILNYLMLNGNMMIPDISSAIGYSVPTVTKYINYLIEKGYIANFGKIGSARGRQPSLYGIKPESAYFIGVDIKRFSLCVAIMDLSGKMVKISEDNDFRFENTPLSLDQICKETSDFIEQCTVKTSNIISVNVNISGRIDSKTGFSYSIFNFEDSDEPLASIMSEKIGKRVYIENDTQAVAYGELVAGNAKQYKDALFVNASWGIGLGIIIDGKLYYGKDGYSGEFGHMNVYNNEVICHCGKKGCLETEVSGSAIIRKLMECIQKGESSILSSKVDKGETITIQDIIDATNKEDTLCIELIQKMGSELGRQLANMINIFNPEAVIIGGSFALISDFFLPPIQMAIRKYSLKLISRDATILPSMLLENAGVTGACMTARHHIFGI